MSTLLEITDGCPHCGQLVMVQLACTPTSGEQEQYTFIPVIVDPQAAAFRAAHPTADHPCPVEETQS